MGRSGRNPAKPLGKATLASPDRVATLCESGRVAFCCLHAQGHLSPHRSPPRGWLSKACEEHSHACWEHCGKGWKAGSVLGRRHWARVGLPRGVPLSSLLPSLLHWFHVWRRSIQAWEALTDRCRGVFAAERAGCSGPPAHRLSCPHPGPEALASSFKWLLSSVRPGSAHTGPKRAVTCSQASSVPRGQETWAIARPSLSPPCPLPRLLLRRWRAKAGADTGAEMGTLCRDSERVGCSKGWQGGLPLAQPSAVHGSRGVLLALFLWSPTQGREFRGVSAFSGVW